MCPFPNRGAIPFHTHIFIHTTKYILCMLLEIFQGTATSILLATTAKRKTLLRAKNT